jgi:hypothetical protein
MKGYFRLKRVQKYYKWDESYYQWRSGSVSYRKKRAGLVKKKDSIYFDSKQRYGSPRITAEYTSLGTKLSKFQLPNTLQELGLEVN